MTCCAREPSIKVALLCNQSALVIYAAAAEPPLVHGTIKRRGIPERLGQDRGRTVSGGRLNHHHRCRHPAALPSSLHLRASHPNSNICSTAHQTTQALQARPRHGPKATSGGAAAGVDVVVRAGT